MALLAGAPSLAQELLAGTWQRHDLRFQYLGFTTLYSCDGLVSKLRVLLKASGARADLQVVEGSCTEIGGHPDRFAGARLVFHAFMPAAADSSGSGFGAWRKVHIADGRPFDLSQGDCELVEQFRDLVLRKAFTTRNLTDRLVCVPHQGGRSFSLDFEVLVPTDP